jgi:hypothetical protein
MNIRGAFGCLRQRNGFGVASLKYLLHQSRQTQLGRRFNFHVRHAAGYTNQVSSSCMKPPFASGLRNVE